LDLGSHSDFGTWVVAASTQNNANLRRYLDENAILIKEAPGDDHHAAVLPSTVSAVLDWTPPDE